MKQTNTPSTIYAEIFISVVSIAIVAIAVTFLMLDQHQTIKQLQIQVEKRDSLIQNQIEYMHHLTHRL